MVRQRRGKSAASGRALTIGLAFVFAIVSFACTAEPESGSEPSAPSHPTPSSPTVTTTIGLGSFPDVPTANLVRARWQAMLDAGIDDGTFRGGVAATVIIADQGVWSGAAGTSDGVHALVPDAQFAIGSVTKTVIAAQVLKLADDGAIDLDAPAADYLPADVPLDSNGATVRQLLAMDAGIRDLPEPPRVWGYDRHWIPLDPARRLTTTDTLEIFANGGVRYIAPGPPGSYSNATYVLLMALIEHVEGESLGAALRSGVLAHEGLERLIMQTDERPTEPLAHPLTDHQPAALAAAFEAGGGYLPHALGGSLTIASDSASLARWMYLLFGGHLVSDASLREMTGERYGPYAMWTEGEGTWGGSGLGSPGTQAYYLTRPDEGLVVVVLTNHADLDDENLGEIYTLGRALADRAGS